MISKKQNFPPSNQVINFRTLIQMTCLTELFYRWNINLNQFPTKRNWALESLIEKFYRKKWIQQARWSRKFRGNELFIWRVDRKNLEPDFYMLCNAFPTPIIGCWLFNGIPTPEGNVTVCEGQRNSQHCWREEWIPEL